jgi:hypothetical protein
MDGIELAQVIRRAAGELRKREIGQVSVLFDLLRELGEALRNLLAEGERELPGAGYVHRSKLACHLPLKGPGLRPHHFRRAELWAAPAAALTPHRKAERTCAKEPDICRPVPTKFAQYLSSIGAEKPSC